MWGTFLLNSPKIMSFRTRKKSMASRDARLYDDTDSIFESQKLVKEYVKSLYGASSPQYAQVKGLEFKKVR